MIAHVALVVRDYDEAIEFYTQRLGFELLEDTPLELIRHLRPDVLVKGGDYEPATVVGRGDVEGWGGRVVIVPLRPGQSTTSIIEKVRAPR